MPTELIESPEPLTSDEIKEGIAFKVAEAVHAALNSHCALYGKSYGKFSAHVRVEFRLDDFGRVVEGVREGTVVGDEGPADSGAAIQTLRVEIPETPPNQFRRETQQEVPALNTAKGSKGREQAGMVTRAQRGGRRTGRQAR